MIETKRLSYFVQIAQDGSLSKAAESLQIAQPALSRQLQLLEEFLGCPLFVRTGRGMKITREGSLLRNAVAGPLREIELSVENMRSFLSTVEMPISVGLHPDMAKLMAEPLMLALENELPKVKLRILEAPSDVLIEWLKQGSIDFAVVDYPSPDEALKDRLIVNDDLVVLGESTLVEQTIDGLATLDIQALATLPLVLPSPHHGVRKVLSEAANLARVKLNVVHEVDTDILLIKLVKQQKGVLVLPNRLALWIANEHDLVIREFTEPQLQLGTYLSNRGSGEIESSVVTRTDRIIQQIILDLLDPIED